MNFEVSKEAGSVRSFSPLIDSDTLYVYSFDMGKECIPRKER